MKKTRKARKERAAVDWSTRFTVDVYEEVHDTHRHDEDGDPILRSTLCLRATDGTGRRWISPYVHDEVASAKSERRHLSRDFDPVAAGWYEAEPMYGSAAWTPEVEARLAREERRAEGWGDRPVW